MSKIIGGYDHDHLVNGQVDKDHIMFAPYPTPSSPSDATGVDKNLPPISQGSGTGVYTSQITPDTFADIKGTRRPSGETAAGEVYRSHLDSVQKAIKDPFHQINYPTISDQEMNEHKAIIEGATNALTQAANTEDSLRKARGKVSLAGETPHD